MISTVSAYSEIPCLIRGVEDGYGDSRLSWFSSLPPDSFVTTTSAVLDLCVRIQRSSVWFAASKTVMVTQDCRGFPHYLRTALLRRHQLSSICVCVFRDPVYDSRRRRRLWWLKIVVVLLITSGQLCYDDISCPRSVCAYSEIPCLIRGVEDGYGDARLSWFSSLPPYSFVTTSSAVLDLCLRIQRSRVRFASWKTVMVTQDCRGFPHYLRTALLRRHQLSSICVWVFRDPVFDSHRGRRLWWRKIVVVFLITSGRLCYHVINWPRCFPSTRSHVPSASNQPTAWFECLTLAVVRDELTAEEASSIMSGLALSADQSTILSSWDRERERERETPFI